MVARPGFPWCPVAAVGAWIEASGRRSGALFVSLQRGRHVATAGTDRLSGRAVARVTVAAAKRAGLAGTFSGHSLRRGLASTALEADVPLEQVARHLRHRHVQTTLGYARERDAAAAHPRVGLGAADAPGLPAPRTETPAEHDGAPAVDVDALPDAPRR